MFATSRFFCSKNECREPDVCVFCIGSNMVSIAKPIEVKLISEWKHCLLKCSDLIA